MIYPSHPVLVYVIRYTLALIASDQVRYAQYLTTSCDLVRLQPFEREIRLAYHGKRAIVQDLGIDGHLFTV